MIWRLHALGVIDAAIGNGLRARNERRRNGLLVIVERYCNVYGLLMPPHLPIAIDTLHMLTSFETFDALSGGGRKLEDIVELIRTMAHHAIGFRSRFVPS